MLNILKKENSLFEITSQLTNAVHMYRVSCLIKFWIIVAIALVEYFFLPTALISLFIIWKFASSMQKSIFSCATDSYFFLQIFH